MSLLSSYEPALKKHGGAFREALGLFLLVLVPLLPYLVTACRLSYLAYNNSSDSFLYFDIARQLARGDGFLLTFNPYQYWPGISYPALSFVHVGYPLFLSALRLFLPSIQQLIYFNFVFAFVNSYLIYLIARKLYDDRVVAAWSVCLIAATVSMEITLLRLLTEQMSLLLVLAAALFFISKKELSVRRLAALGFLLGAGFFIRASAILYCFIFFLAALFSKEEAGRRGFKILFLLLIPLLVAGLYEIFVFLRYGALFPEYPEAFKSYYVATFFTGAKFFPQMPVIRPAGEAVSLFYGVNARDMARVLFCILRFLLFFSLLRCGHVLKTRQRGEVLLLGLALAPIATTVLFYPYMRVAEFQWTRFLLLPVISLILLGVKGWREAVLRLSPGLKRFAFHSVLAIVFAANFYQSGRVLAVYWKKDEARGRVASLKAVSEWVRSNTQDRDLVAVSIFLLGRVYLDRPTVVLPLYNALNTKNLRDFLSIYKPQAVIFEKTAPEGLGRDLAQSGYKKGEPPGLLGGLFIVFVQSKN